jgi:hypothetical protein
VTNVRRVPWAALVCAVACAAFCAASVAAARAASQPGTPATIRHVVIVGISGLRWADVSPQATPALWRLARAGSVGDLVDYAEQPFACPADGWLTLNGGARAAMPGPCQSLPAVRVSGNGARIPAMPRIVAGNQRFHQTPDWGLLGGLAGCATAVGPGAALALATPSGAVAGYLPAPSAITAGALARCPLTVVDLGTVPSSPSSPERPLLAPLDHALAGIVASLPPGTLLLVTAPGAAPGGRPHLLATVVSGPGYPAGLLHATSTRQPGIVTLTDLTTAVAGWLGRVVPSYVVGARITSGPRGPLAATAGSLTGRDTAEQVWLTTHGWFLAGYALADVVLLGAPLLCWRGSDPRRRRRRARWWRTAGAFLAVVPVATFLANIAPWWAGSHPAVWLYGLAACWALVLGAVALRVTRGSQEGPFGIICLFTLGVLAVDVMTGSRLQPEAPFGLSLLVAGRFYGIGNEALGVYCVCAVAGAAWAGRLALARWPGPRPAIACASAVGLLAVVASGWPGFGAKAGGTIALVPCFVILALALRGVRIGWRKAVPAALSGLVVFAVFALVSYLFPATGVSDIGAFAVNLLHGQGGALLERKASSNLGTLTVSALSPLVPAVIAVTGLALCRPAWFRLAAPSGALAARPLLRVTGWLIWLVLVIGWLADDSGVIVPAAALPFAVPLVIGTCASLSSVDDGVTGYLGSAFAGASVAGQTT